MFTKKLFASTRELSVSVKTRDAAGNEGIWNFTTSRESYAPARAVTEHLKKFHVDENTVVVISSTFTEVRTKQ